jgi:hypothetical protein
MLNSLAHWRATGDFEYPSSHGSIAGRRLASMADETYLVTLRPPSRAVQQVFAASAEVRGDHLVFVDAKGNFEALFLMELVESWSVLPT